MLRQMPRRETPNSFIKFSGRSLGVALEALATLGASEALERSGSKYCKISQLKRKSSIENSKYYKRFLKASVTRSCRQE